MKAPPTKMSKSTPKPPRPEDLAAKHPRKILAGQGFSITTTWDLIRTRTG